MAMDVPPAIVVPAIVEVDIPRFMRALAQVESENNRLAVGKHGELGPWQITRTAWKEVSTYDFAYATDPVIGEQVVAARLDKLCVRIKKAGLPLTAETLAAQWNPRAPSDYRKRVSNLYHAKGVK